MLVGKILKVICRYCSLASANACAHKCPLVRHVFTSYLDSTGPRIYFPRDLPVVTKTNPLFTWTSSEPANFKCAIEGSQLNYVDCGEGTSGNWSGLNIPDGEYKFLVYGTDKMNNRGPTEEHTFTVGELFAKVSVNFF